MSVLSIQIGLAVIGIATWIYGYTRDVSSVRLLAIAFLAVAVLLRFVRPKPPTEPPDSAGPDNPDNAA